MEMEDIFWMTGGIQLICNDTNEDATISMSIGQDGIVTYVMQGEDSRVR